MNDRSLPSSDVSLGSTLSIFAAYYEFHCMKTVNNCYTYFYASLHSKLSEFTSSLDYYYYRWKLV